MAQPRGHPLMGVAPRPFRRVVLLARRARSAGGGEAAGAGRGIAPQDVAVALPIVSGVGTSCPTERRRTIPEAPNRAPGGVARPLKSAERIPPPSLPLFSCLLPSRPAVRPSLSIERPEACLKSSILRTGTGVLGKEQRTTTVEMICNGSSLYSQ